MEYYGVNRYIYVHWYDIIRIKSKPVLPVPDFKQELSSAVPMGFLLKIRK